MSLIFLKHLKFQSTLFDFPPTACIDSVIFLKHKNIKQNGILHVDSPACDIFKAHEILYLFEKCLAETFHSFLIQLPFCAQVYFRKQHTESPTRHKDKKIKMFRNNKMKQEVNVTFHPNTTFLQNFV